VIQKEISCDFPFLFWARRSFVDILESKLTLSKYTLAKLNLKKRLERHILPIDLTLKEALKKLGYANVSERHRPRGHSR
jgi:hypothetical protein